MGPDIADLMGAADVELFDWQRVILDQWCELTPGARPKGGRLTRQTCALLVPRRNGKTFLVLARMIGGALLMDERRQLFTAQDFGPCREFFDVAEEVLSHPTLSLYVKKVYRANGQERIVFTNGAEIKIRTRGGNGGRGLESDLLVFDEALILSAEKMGSLTPLTAKAQAQGRGQRIFTSSAGDAEAEILRSIRERGRALKGQPGGNMAYAEYCVPDDANPLDRANWALANPSLGLGILEENYLQDQATILRADHYAREHLGIWGDSAALPAIDPAKWEGLATETEPEIEDAGTWLAFDIAPERTRASLLLFRKSTDGRVVVNVLETRETPLGIDTNEFSDAVLAAAEEWQPECVGYDRLTGTRVAERLEAEGHRVRNLTAGLYAAACLALEHAVDEGHLAHDGSPTLAVDLSRAIRKPFSDGGWTFTRLGSTAGPIPGAVCLATGFYLASNPEVSDSMVKSA